jgi:hypothetical protein
MMTIGINENWVVEFFRHDVKIKVNLKSVQV